MNLAKSPGQFTSDLRSPKLGKLSDEVSRIAGKLAKLALEHEVPSEPGSSPLGAAKAKADIPIEAVRREIHARRLRSQYFDSHLFADPAWDMLLELFRSEIAQQRVSVSALTMSAGVPATTALRWLKTMTDANLFFRRPDPTDARRFYVELSPRSSEAMRAYFAHLDRLGY